MTPGMKRLPQFSTGVGSAEVAWRIVERYGPDDVVLLTADTLAEDEDNWRFAKEVVAALGCEWVILADGRRPMEVGLDLRVVPNNRMAVCSRVLKRELIREHLDANRGFADLIRRGRVGRVRLHRLLPGGCLVTPGTKVRVVATESMKSLATPWVGRIGTVVAVHDDDDHPCRVEVDIPTWGSVRPLPLR